MSDLLNLDRDRDVAAAGLPLQRVEVGRVDVEVMPLRLVRLHPVQVVSSSGELSDRLLALQGPRALPHRVSILEYFLQSAGEPVGVVAHMDLLLERLSLALVSLPRPFVELLKVLELLPGQRLVGQLLVRRPSAYLLP
jgi:hypothetical protein